MKKAIKIISAAMIAVLLLVSVPFYAFASNVININDNYLFRPLKSFALSAGESYNLTYTPEYTAKYTMVLHGVKNGGGRNINAWLYDSNDNLLVDGTENRTTYDYVTISYTLEKGKSYYYKVEGLLATTSCDIEVNFTSVESGLLDDENGLKARMSKVEFSEYSVQEVLNNLKLIIYDKDKNSFEWTYKDAQGNTFFNGSHIVIDTYGCGKVGINTIRVHYLGYLAECEFEILPTTTTKPTTTTTTKPTTTTTKPTTKPTTAKPLRAGSAYLSTTAYTYNGKIHTPSVTVKSSTGSKLAINKDYTIKYSNSKSKSVGYYTVKITYKGRYSTNSSKTLVYTIGPKTTASLTSLSTKSKNIYAKWKKNTYATGYQIQIAENSSFKNAKSYTITKKSTVSKTFSKLKKGKKYYVRIRAYKSVSGKKCYAYWSAKKSITCK